MILGVKYWVLPSNAGMLIFKATRPRFSMRSDRTKIKTEAMLLIKILFLPFKLVNMTPVRSIRGMVPRPKRTIDKAPFSIEDVDKAYSCMA